MAEYKCIRKHSSLTTLSVSNCERIDDCVEHIVNVIEGNRYITHIDVSQTDITPKLNVVYTASHSLICKIHSY
jgi:hypothetical protein